MVTTSPGRYAVPDGMFSAIGRYAVTATSGLSAAIAIMAAATAAAPAMSHFISHMPCGRLDRHAAGVEGDALADQRDAASSRPRGV